MKIKSQMKLNLKLFKKLAQNLCFLYNNLMKRILLKIAYNGSKFHGWQRQEGQRTVQGEIENAIFVAFKQHCDVFASGRTDAGVHALAQQAHFDIEDSVPVNKIKTILNRVLPLDITILSAKKMKNDFHARFNVTSKTYMYKLYTGERNCFICDKVAFVTTPFDIDKMKYISKLFVGEHNFKGFCSSQTSSENFVRTIYNIEFIQKKNILNIEITGNGFLMNMVRILVGSMLDYAQGKITEEKLKNALEKGDRSQSGRTMPPQGLYLKKVYY